MEVFFARIHLTKECLYNLSNNHFVGKLNFKVYFFSMARKIGMEVFFARIHLTKECLYNLSNNHFVGKLNFKVYFFSMAMGHITTFIKLP